MHIMENNQIRLDVECTIAPKRMAYSTPSLTVYGELQDLTAGGSGRTMESAGENYETCTGMQNRSCRS